VVLAQFAGYGGPDDPYIVMLAWASYGVGRHARLDRQPWAAAGALLLISLNVAGGDARIPGDIVFPVLFTAVPWILGLLVQRATHRADHATLHADRLQAERDRELEEAAEAERLRIARDLHDVAAHCLTVVSLQAQVARRRVEAGQPVDAATMRQIESSAAEALSALRSVVGALRPAGDEAANAPVPGLEALPALVAQSKAAGQDVTLSQSGQAQRLTPAADLAVYRVVQESVTNALRHGGPGTTAIDLTWQPSAVEVTVRSPLGTTAAATPHPGHGLVGMRERVSLLGGRLQTGPQGSHWVVLASVPLTGAGD
jgi:signal transduction histidine kinase